MVNYFVHLKFLIKFSCTNLMDILPTHKYRNYNPIYSPTNTISILTVVSKPVYDKYCFNKPDYYLFQLNKFFIAH